MKKIFIFIVVIAILLLMKIYFIFFIGLCGLKGCHNSCEQNADCSFYKIIGDCRNLEYKYSKEYFDRILSFDMFRLYKEDKYCECISSGIIRECRAV